MTIDFIQRLLVFVTLLLVQSMVLNRIQLFDCATPLLTVYFIVSFPRSYPRWAILLWSFALGLCTDMFANTPGVGAASLTLIGFLQPFLIELFLPREAEENIRAAVATLGVWRFLALAACLTIVFCLTFFALEQFSFFNWHYWLLCSGGSALLTLLLLMTIEGVRK